MPHPLSVRYEGCVARIGRSREHLKALIDEIEAFEAMLRRGEAQGITSKFDSASGYEIHYLMILKPMPLMRWGVLVGDVVHQARATLDNLIELLNIRKMGHALNKTTFPIYPDRETYLDGKRGKRGKSGRPPGFKKAGNVGGDAATLIESFQPYHRGNDYEADPLWILQGLWIMDKHRNPAVVGVGGQTVGVRMGARATSGDPVVYGNPDGTWPRSFRIEDGAELGRFRVRHGPNTDVYVEHDLSVEVFLSEGQPGAKRFVASQLRECVDRVDEVVRAFAPFFRDPMCSCE